MPECPECGSKWPETYKFCPECGAAIRPESRGTRARSRSRVTERRHAVVLFADVKGYTALSAEIDPEELHRVMQGVYNLMGQSVSTHGGTVAKYIGDSVMALFGVPEAHENDEARAVRCALDLQRRMAKYPEVRGRQLALTIGISSGLVVAGDLGDAEKFDFDALGDAVNIASRLQGKAEAGQVVVSERVYRRTQPQFAWEMLGKFALRNVPYPVEAYRAISERDPAEVAEFAGAGLARLCGRDTEMTTIDELLKVVAGGAGRVLGITGDAGVGKSRLVYELRTRAEDLGARVLTGRTLPYGLNMPLLPLKEVLRRFAGLKTDEKPEDAQSRIRRAFSPCWSAPEIREIRVTTVGWFLGYPFPGAVVEMLEGKAKQNLLEATLNEFFLALTDEEMGFDAPHRGNSIREEYTTRRHTPLVLVLEDMHWTDQATKDWIVQFARLIEKMPILVTLAYRHGFEYNWSSEPLVTFSEIVLKPIAGSAVGEMVSSILLVDSAPPELVRFVVEKSQGNPFFAEEIVRHLLEEKIVSCEMNLADGTTKVNVASPLESVEIPTSVQGLILSRIDRLEESTRRTSQEASVVGHSFLEKVLSKISTAKEECKKHLDDLAAFEVVYEKSKLPEIEYMFRHILVRDAVYETLLKYERRKLHKAVADAIESLFPERMENFYSLLAHHLNLAGDTQRAAHYLWREGKRLQESGDLKSAHATLSDAYELSEENHEDRPEIVLDLAAVSVDADTAQAAYDILQKMPENISSRQAARRYIVEGKILDFLGRYVEAEERLESGRAAAEKLGETELACRALSGVGGTQWKRGNLDEAQARLQASLDMALRHGDKRNEAAGLNNVGLVKWNRGHLDAALEYMEKSLEAYREIGDKHGQSIALGNIGLVYRSKGQQEQAAEYFEKGLELCDAIGDRQGTALLLSNLGLVSHDRSDLEGALEYFQRGLEFSRALGEKSGEARALGNIGWIYGKLGDLDRALEYQQQSLGIRNAIGDMDGKSLALCNLGEAYLHRGETDKARENTKAALEIATQLGAKGRCAWCSYVLAEVEASDGNYDASDKALDDSKKLHRECGILSDYVCICTLGACSALKRADAQKAQDHLDEAEEVLPQVTQHPVLRDYYVARARLVAELGQLENADKTFKRALEHAARCIEKTNCGLYYRYGRFLAEWVLGSKKAAREYLEKARTIYEQRVAHGAHSDEFDQVKNILESLKRNEEPS